jgi:hypothetical protein
MRMEDKWIRESERSAISEGSLAIHTHDGWTSDLPGKCRKTKPGSARENRKQGGGEGQKEKVSK